MLRPQRNVAAVVPASRGLHFTMDGSRASDKTTTGSVRPLSSNIAQPLHKNTAHRDL